MPFIIRQALSATSGDSNLTTPHPLDFPFSILMSAYSTWPGHREGRRDHNSSGKPERSLRLGSTRPKSPVEFQMKSQKGAWRMSTVTRTHLLQPSTPLPFFCQQDNNLTSPVISLPGSFKCTPLYSGELGGGAREADL